MRARAACASRRSTRRRRAGIEIASRDAGPGIADLAAALRDGCSTGGGRGSGLPAVRRLMDEFAITSGPGGTRITARKWRTARIAIVAATRPHPHETVSGDAWTVQWAADGACRLAVVDGLGHGPAAHEAAAAAVRALAAAPDLAPERALALCQRALAGTRGAALAIVRIDLAAGRLTYAGVGNVEGRLWRPEGERRLLAQRGIVGATLPTIRPVDARPRGGLAPASLHSDGVSDRFASAALPEWGGPIQPLAEAILRRHGRVTDDATVLIARAPARAG